MGASEPLARGVASHDSPMSPPEAPSDSESDSEFTLRVAKRMAMHDSVRTRSIDSLVKQQTKKCMEFFAKWRCHKKNLAYWPAEQPEFSDRERLDLASQGKGPACPFSILGSFDGSTKGRQK